jgi:hypothetical protein
MSATELRYLCYLCHWKLRGRDVFRHQGSWYHYVPDTQPGSVLFPCPKSHPVRRLVVPPRKADA